VTALEQDRYPIGRFQRCARPLGAAARAVLIDQIERAPAAIRSLVTALGDDQLDTPYREGGWTIRQVVHHVPDSHMNSYVRMKLAVTETAAPKINAYDEGRWAELVDGKSLPVSVSLELLAALHGRWVPFLRSLSDEHFLKTYIHPELGPYPLYDALALYAWHGRHHAAHIENALRRLAG
jgi:DinB family protein